MDTKEKKGIHLLGVFNSCTETCWDNGTQERVTLNMLNLAWHTPEIPAGLHQVQSKPVLHNTSLDRDRTLILGLG